MQWQRRIFVIGSSGVGKSSLINAGLVPYLRNKEVKEGWLVRRVLPGEPGKTLLEMLADVLAGDLTQLENRVKTLLERAHKRRLSLIIDSYERVFTQSRREPSNSALSRRWIACMPWTRVPSSSFAR